MGRYHIRCDLDHASSPQSVPSFPQALRGRGDDHEAVSECGVVGIPDEERGQIVKAFVVLKPGYIANVQVVPALQDCVKATIAPYKDARKSNSSLACPAPRPESCSDSSCASRAEG